MLIAHNPGKEIRPGVEVWASTKELNTVAFGYTDLSTGKWWPTHISIEETQGEERVSTFYELYGEVVMPAARSR
jgi:hypothetical protein